MDESPYAQSVHLNLGELQLRGAVYRVMKGMSSLCDLVGFSSENSIRQKGACGLNLINYRFHEDGHKFGTPI